MEGWGVCEWFANAANGKGFVPFIFLVFLGCFLFGIHDGLVGFCLVFGL